MHPEDLAGAQHARDEAIGGGVEYSYEYRLRNSAGDYLWVEEIGTAAREHEPGREPGRELGTMRGILLDISQRKDKSLAWQVYLCMTMGATRTQLGKQVRVSCDDQI